MEILFRQREQSFENKFAYELEANFRIRSMAIKMLGRWVGEKMGLPVNEREVYAFELADFNLSKPHFEAMIDKIRNDLAIADIDISTHRISTIFDEKIMEARQAFLEPR